MPYGNLMKPYQLYGSKIFAPCRCFFCIYPHPTTTRIFLIINYLHHFFTHCVERTYFSRRGASGYLILRRQRNPCQTSNKEKFNPIKSNYRDGLQKTYYENGKLMVESNYK